ncbi:hypothetical protein DKM44_01700 [Deinococcus irradiatisoli]|uniref:DUF1206 domain-containing protein n=1 Tax=Deinococcus irradiatisoli TaxID=2202254 RepID=A0A2Z3JAI4_9DEIO|nr:DUF1206 domain-containing protein [Deinococcus irradiatisoli]AWN22113.1 hypothetical protein DKM44_01700 [Deinococcus irradiatisoli]
MSSSPTVGDAKRLAEQGAAHAAPWIEILARVGYVSKGLVYLTVGVLSLLQAAHRPGGETTDQRGALHSLAQLPLGRELLILLGVGLAGYALWQVVRTLLDPEQLGLGAKALAKRVGYLLSAVAYASLALAAAFHQGGSASQGSGNQSAQDWTARLLQAPGGQLLVGLVGAVLIGVALRQLYVAYTSKFMQYIQLTDLGAKHRTLMRRVGQLGIAARGVVAALIGFFFVQAAWQADPSRAGGLQQALRTFAQAPYGRALLALAALGLAAYGLYCWVQAAYRRIHIRN